MSKFRRFSLPILIILALCGALVLSSQRPAEANWNGCPFNTFCTYWDADGAGSVYYYSPTSSCITIGAPWNTNISSVWNHTDTSTAYSGYTVRLYKDSTCSALVWGVWTVSHGAYGNTIPGWNDQIHSLWFRPSS